MSGVDPRVAERFWARVEKTDGCWLWTASTRRGYGRFYIGQGRSVQAHRFAYEMLVGPIQEGLTLDHLCRSRACVNPQHLEPVTNAENVLRGIGPTAVNAAKTECKRGHDLTDEANVRINGRGERLCRACQREYQRQRWESFGRDNQRRKRAKRKAAQDV